MITLHIAIALTSLAVSLSGLFVASQKLLYISYGLIAATVASGTALVLVEKVNVVHVCVSGLVYVTIATLLTRAAARRVRSHAN